MTTLRAWFAHFTLPHYASLDPARMGMAAARFSSWPKRKVESCKVCNGFIVRLSR